MSIQSITEIREHRDKIKASLSDFPTSKLNDKYGSEKEYTAKGIREGIGSILIDVTALTKTPAQFIQKSTWEERKQVAACLENINSHIENQDINNLAIAIDEIKPIIRNTGIHYTDERVEALNESLSELIDSFENNRERSEEIEQLLVNSQSHNEVMENFSEKIANREIQLENQGHATEKYKKELAGFRTDHEDYLSEAKDLIERAKLALEYTTAEGLSAAFTEQYNKADTKSKNWWLWLAAASIIAAVVIGGWLTTGESLSLEIIIARFSLLPILIAAAWFCAGQYVKQRNIAEDYAYKAALAKSIVGFSEQLSTESSKGEEYSYFMQRVLSEMLNDPLRKHSQKAPTRFRLFRGSKEETKMNED